ncbi:EAL domain-containing protein [Marivita sp.]|uniref:EAL domain-containing protein n=1 Tax=Marivita sp. TaxID=2003365 RepID=UPI0025BE1799|nr:EAL domain-containing protein [Marivita sp.]
MSGTTARPVEAVELTRAFEKGDLMLHYQPQVDVSHRWPKIVGYEALARWPLSDGNFISPDRFIPVAEASGIVTALDIWVIETVCKEMAHARTKGASGRLNMSANVSAQHFGEAQFAQSVADILEKTGVDPGCLTLEITERAVLAKGDLTMRNILDLREMGVSLTLDDFGTGYSSLFHLKCLPVQEVKLDRSFITDLPHQARDAAIVSATIKLASELGLRVVAEGVERASQASWLRTNGCQIIQGFLYGRPAARRHHQRGA